MRSCLGRMFSELDSLGFLFVIIMTYRITFKPEA